MDGVQFVRHQVSFENVRQFAVVVEQDHPTPFRILNLGRDQARLRHRCGHASAVVVFDGQSCRTRNSSASLGRVHKA